MDLRAKHSAYFPRVPEQHISVMAYASGTTGAVLEIWAHKYTDPEPTELLIHLGPKYCISQPSKV